MNRKLKFVISLLLILSLVFSCLCLPASSFANEVDTSTVAMLVINMDTDTIVYSEKPDNLWYQGNLVELMTYLVAYENIDDIDGAEFKVDYAFLNALPYKDNCLEPYRDKTLTARDLMAIMLLTSGSDAAFALADLTTDGDRDAFVEMMNEKAVALGCANTLYVAPGYSDSNVQHTSCRDLFLIYTAARSTELFQDVMSERTYTPDGMEGDNVTAETEASILRENSPFYFRYANDAKYSYTDATSANLVATTTYHDVTYFFAGLLGVNETEDNIFADARKLTTWAYLHLSDRKVLNTDEAMASVNVNVGWGNYNLELYAVSADSKTFPAEFDENLLSYSVNSPADARLPLFSGQKMGTATVLYDGEAIDTVDLAIHHDEGLDMLSDTAKFCSNVMDQLLINGSDEAAQAESTEAPADSGDATEA